MFIYLDFHSFSYAYIYPIIYILSCVTRNQFPTADDLKIEDKFPFLFPFLCSLAETTCGLVLVYIKCYKNCTKELKMKEVTIVSGSTSFKKQELVNKANEMPKQSSDLQLKVLIPLSLGNFFICFISFCLGGVKRINDHNYTYQIGTLSLIWLTFLCHKLLKAPIYTHHFISIGLICTCQIVLGFSVWFTVEEFKEEPYLLVLDFSLLLLCDLFFSTKHAIEKYLMEKKDMLVYKIIFIEGVLGIIINVIFVFVLWYVPCPFDLPFCVGGPTVNFEKLKNNLVQLPGTLFLFYLFSIGVNLFVLLTNKFFSPTHRFVFDTVSSIIQIVINELFIEKKPEEEAKEMSLPWKITTIITYGVIFVGCLIYNEILVLNFCGIGDFTKNRIIERASLDASENIINISLIGKDDRDSRNNDSLVSERTDSNKDN